MEKKVVYPGTFDPLTYGHMNIIERGLKIFDRVVVAVARNTAKRTTFDVEERVSMIREIFRDRDRVEVDSFEGLLVDYMRRKKICVILRGLRTISDFEYEFQMALANKQLDQNVETFFMVTEGAFSYLSSTLIKEIVMLGGSVSGMVPELVERKLKEKLLRR